MNLVQTFDKILLNDNVKKIFYEEYKNNNEFYEFLRSNLNEVIQSVNHPQNNEWHIYDIMDHILYSVENMNKLTKNMPQNERRMLSYIMFFHDLGKPSCKTVRIENNKEHFSFKNHNLAGELIAKRALKLFNFSSAEQKLMALLIREHDAFIALKCQKADPNDKVLIQEKLNVLYENYSSVENANRFVYYLLLISLCDNLSQNLLLSNNGVKIIMQMIKILPKQENVTIDIA